MTVFSLALIPIIVLITTGFLIRKSGFLSDEAWVGIEKLTYFVLFPALLIRTLGTQSISQVPWQHILLVVALVLLSASCILLVFHRLGVTRDGPEFTSLFQGGVRFNTYITLAVAQSFFGEPGLAQGAVVVGFMVVLANLLCVSVFQIWGKSEYQGISVFSALRSRESAYHSVRHWWGIKSYRSRVVSGRGKRF